MAVLHSTVVGVADDGTSDLGSNEWNAQHVHPAFEIVFVADNGNQVSFTNLGGGPTELTNSRSRTRIDLTTVTEVRLLVCQALAASSGTWCRVQRSTSSSMTSPVYLDAAGSGPSVTLSTSANVLVESSWVAIDAAGDEYLRVVCGGGDSAADPSFYKAVLQLR